jgi:hypothetical protein
MGEFIMEKCTFEYNMNSDWAGRIGMFTCRDSKHNSFHGDLIFHIVSKYNFCPFCGKEINFVNEGKK